MMATSTQVRFVPPKYVEMKSIPDFVESNLEAILKENIALLGLGDLLVKDTQRRQPGRGRLDLLLHDPESQTRYTVELQLGSLDESHIIRAIEYWDIESERFPQYKHVAVVAAEEVTGRFYNVIRLISKNIPLIAIELKVIDNGDGYVIVATQVVKPVERGTDEEDEGTEVNRQFWMNKGAEQTVKLMDDLVDRLNELYSSEDQCFQPKYNQQYIGLKKTGGPINFMTFVPQKKWLQVRFKISQDQSLSEQIEEALDMMSYDVTYGNYRVRMYSGDLTNQAEEIDLLIRRAYEEYAS